MIGSNLLKNKFGRNHVIHAQPVTEVSIGVLSVIFPLKIIIILRWAVCLQELLIVGCIFVWHAIKVLQKDKCFAKQCVIS